MSIPKYDIGQKVKVNGTVEQISVNSDGVFYQVAFPECALHNQFGTKAVVSEDDLGGWLGVAHSHISQEEDGEGNE